MDNIVLRAQPAKREAVAAAGLLDQGGDAQSAKDAVAALAHIIFDRQNKTSRKLPKGRTSAGKGGAIRVEAPLS